MKSKYQPRTVPLDFFKQLGFQNSKWEAILIPTNYWPSNPLKKLDLLDFFIASKINSKRKTTKIAQQIHGLEQFSQRIII